MSGSLLSLPGSIIAIMRVLVLSVTTGEQVWDYTSGSFWQARGWELHMSLCEAIHCAQYFSVILLVRQLLLCDMAFIGEYADGDVLTVHMLRWGIADPTDSDMLQVTSALRYSNRLGLWTVLSRGYICESFCQNSQEARRELALWSLPYREDIRKTRIWSMNCPTRSRPSLWACCSPHDFGMPEVSPPCRREEGSNDPIFVAIQMSSAENVHRLLQYTANPRS